jgi:hypothetical protein
VSFDQRETTKEGELHPVLICGVSD